MDKTELLIEEYKLTFENYKFSFQQSLEVAKFYVTIISIFVVGFVLKFQDIPNKNEISSEKNLIVFVLLILILFGLFFSILQYTIIKKRRYLIKRMNYLRNTTFKIANCEKEIEEYNKIAGFKRTIDHKKYALQISTLAPFIFTILITILLLYVLFRQV